MTTPITNVSPVSAASIQEGVKEERWDHLKVALKNLGMITGQEALQHSGLASGHVCAISGVVQGLDTFVAIRPVNNQATSLIASMAAVKGLDDTHLKSASTGPMAGFIPTDPRLGKSGLTLLQDENANPNVVFKIDSAKPDVVASALVISQSRLDELLDTGVMSESQNGKVVCGGEQPSSLDNALNAHFEFRLSELKDGNFAVQYKTKTSPQKDLAWKNVEVVAKQSEPGCPALPMTADYDVLGYFPHLSAFKDATLPVKSSGVTVREQFQHLKKNNATRMELKQGLVKAVANKVRQEMLGQADRNNPNPSKGSFTEAEDHMATALNKALRPEVYDSSGNVKPDSAGVLIKHGPEVNNPRPENDEQVTIIGPKEMVFVTRSQKQMLQALSLLRNNDHLVYFNRNWDATQSENDMIRANKPWKTNPFNNQVADQTKRIEHRPNIRVGLSDLTNTVKQSPGIVPNPLKKVSRNN